MIRTKRNKRGAFFSFFCFSSPNVLILTEYSSFLTTKIDLQSGRFKNYVFPVFKDIPIKEVKTTHLEDLLRDIQTEYNIHETPRRLRQDFINVFKYAVKREYCDNNIAREVDRLALPQVESRPAITERKRIDEFGLVIYKLYNNKEDIVLSTAIKLLPQLFARPKELRSMRWSDIDFKHAEWSYKMTKVSKQRLVPLSSQAIVLLRELYKHNLEFIIMGNFPNKILFKDKFSTFISCKELS